MKYPCSKTNPSIWEEFKRKFQNRFGLSPTEDFYREKDAKIALKNGNLERTVYKN